MIKRNYLDTKHGQIHYWQAGTGPDLLLVHQSAQCADEYTGLVPFLSDQFRLTALDLPGHGYSSAPATECTVDDYAAATITLMEALGLEQAAFCGHHGGSSIGIAIAASAPSLISRLILSGSGIRTPEEAKALLTTRGSHDVPSNLGPEFFAGMWSRYQNYFGEEASERDKFRVYVAGLQSKLWPFDAHDAIMQWDRKKFLPLVKCPVLLIQGELDSFVQRQEELQAMIPGAERTVIPDAGAFMFFEAPQACAEVIARFLGSA